MNEDDKILPDSVVPVQGVGRGDGLTKEHVPPGLISWAEHYEAWFAFNKAYPRGESAEVTANNGGFSFNELVQWLGHPPKSWKPRNMSKFKQFWEEMYNPSEDPAPEPEPVEENDNRSHLWYGDGTSICKSETDDPTTPFNFDIVEGDPCERCMDKVLLWLRKWNGLES